MPDASGQPAVSASLPRSGWQPRGGLSATQATQVSASGGTAGGAVLAWHWHRRAVPFNGLLNARAAAARHRPGPAVATRRMRRSDSESGVHPPGPGPRGVPVAAPLQVSGPGPLPLPVAGGHHGHGHNATDPLACTHPTTTIFKSGTVARW